MEIPPLPASRANPHPHSLPTAALALFGNIAVNSHLDSILVPASASFFLHLVRSVLSFWKAPSAKHPPKAPSRFGKLENKWCQVIFIKMPRNQLIFFPSME
jgi:hypothetical protein